MSTTDRIGTLVIVFVLTEACCRHSLSIERDELMDAFVDPEKLNSDLVSRANAYKSRAKAFFVNVQVRLARRGVSRMIVPFDTSHQKALEVAHDKIDPTWSMLEPLTSYQFPERSGASSSDMISREPDTGVPWQEEAPDAADDAMDGIHITMPTSQASSRVDRLERPEVGGSTYSALGLYNLYPSVARAGETAFPRTLFSPSKPIVTC